MATRAPESSLVQLLWALAARYAVLLLVVLSLGLVVLAKADIKLVGFFADRAGDLFRPVAFVFAEPLMGIRQLSDRIGAVLALQSENERLRDENRRLLAWQSEAVRLRVQNAALRDMLRMPPQEAAPPWTTARIVADTGGPFIQTRLIDAGTNRGIRKGMAVTDGYGLVGRVIDVGERSARVLLVTDFNSRIPIIADRSRDQAILEGTNSELPELRFLPINPTLAVGDRVLTSGRGGVLPPGLPIGEIVVVDEQRVVVRTYVDWDRLDYVSVLHYQPVPTPDGALPTDEPAPAADVIARRLSRSASGRASGEVVGGPPGTPPGTPR